MSMNILVVDDSKLALAVMDQTLEMVEIDLNELYKASNGKEGLEVLHAHPVDLVFSDIHMPVMDGVEMIGAMQEDERLKNIPVVVISSEGSLKRIEELKKKGIKSFIRKPFTPEMVADVIAQVMRGGEDG